MLIDLYQIVSQNITYIDVALSSIKLSHTYKIQKNTHTHNTKTPTKNKYTKPNIKITQIHIK